MKNTTYNANNKYFIYGVALTVLLALAGCDDTRKNFRVKQAEYLCKSHGGVLDFKPMYGELALVCKNGTSYEYSEVIETILPLEDI